MISQNVSFKQIKGLREAREMGIAIGQFGKSDEYDVVFAPFMKLVGLIGQYERALQTYNNSPNSDYWISEQRKLEEQFVALYQAVFSKTKPISFLPQKWIADFYSKLNHRE